MSKSENQNLDAMRHSLAHIMAASIQKLWPQAKFGVGPVIENGFYYDVDLGKSTLKPEDLLTITATMQELIKADEPFEQADMPIEEALEWAIAAKQDYKVELLNDLKTHGTTSAKDIDAKELGLSEIDKKITTVSTYKSGEFVDLCRGPHVASTGKVGAFKLNKIAGAYWRGKESNPQLQRIYGVAFTTKSELDDHLQHLEEAKKNDHRVLGRKLDLFTFSDLVGPGLPLYTPRGTVVRNKLKQALFNISKKYGALEVSIPHIAKLDLYKTSGHADKFADELFEVKSHYDVNFVMKPVNCPHHFQIYSAQPRSYKDLPLAYIEFTTQYRDEKPGQIGGLARTRGFTVDDGHTFCTSDQIKSEVENIVNVIKEFYSSLGMWGEHWVSLSVRDPQNQDAYLGEVADWDKAEKFLDEVCQEQELAAKRIEGEAAIYGPKIDFMFKDVYGHDVQLATIQLDFAMPKRFGLVYIDEAGKEQTPVVIHRAIAGSFERFLMLLLEKLGGNFPIWLAPEQVRLVCVNDEATSVKFAQKIYTQIKEAGVRVELDVRNESVGKKIRDAEVMKVPYVLVLGEKEMESGKFVPRVRKDIAVEHAEQPVALEQFIQTVVNETKSHVHNSSL